MYSITVHEIPCLCRHLENYGTVAPVVLCQSSGHQVWPQENEGCAEFEVNNMEIDAETGQLALEVPITFLVQTGEVCFFAFLSFSRQELNIDSLTENPEELLEVFNAERAPLSIYLRAAVRRASLTELT